MPNATVNGLSLAYETFGNPEGRPLLLIMGLGSQMLLWDEDFCDLLAEGGHYVIRFDNRDVGLSSRCRRLGRPSLARALWNARRGRPVQTAYTLDDMAGDAIGLLDELGIPQAHIMGASMGGMIAQATAIGHPERVLSLVSFMSSTGNPRLPGPTWKATRFLLRRPPREKQAFIEYAVQLWQTIGSPGYPFDEERTRWRSARVFDRGLPGGGTTRQMVAILAHGDRRPDLAGLSLPCLVIHGKSDPLVPVAGGIDTAKSIPGAELLLLDGVGHSLPRELWPRVVDAVEKLTAKASSTLRAQPAESTTPDAFLDRN